MNAYKRYVTIDQSQELVLSNLPFTAGQRVEIIILAEEPKIDPQLEALRAQIDLGTEQILAGDVRDGEAVFEELNHLLATEYGME